MPCGRNSLYSCDRLLLSVSAEECPVTTVKPVCCLTSLSCLQRIFTGFCSEQCTRIYYQSSKQYIIYIYIKVNVKFTLEQAMKAERTAQ